MKKLFILTLFGLLTHLSSFAQTPITGVMGCCVGATGFLLDSASSPGTWSSSNTAVATINSGGTVYGVSAGVTTITFDYGTGFVTTSYTVSPMPAAITGAAGECVGTSITLSDATLGGTWSSTSPAVATVGVSTGVVTGALSGFTYIYYNMGVGCFAYLANTVGSGSTPSAITGTSTVCLGTTITLADATGGGTWSSSSTGIATVSTAGVVSGVSAGTATITYSVLFSCGTGIATKTITVTSSASPDSILGPSTVCVGAAITLTDASTGGAWSSSSGAATVTSGGVVSGVSVGTATISYTVTGSCISGTVTRTISVISTVSAGSITGPSTVEVASTITLADGISGGTWSSSNTSIAIVNPYSGIVTGEASGTVTITYTVSGCGGSYDATTVVTVTPFDGISGNVNFTSGAYYGPVKVWLINYDPTTHMLTAIDSSTIYSSGTSAYYQFTGLTTDSFRVKAGNVDSVFAGAGYVPTYHTSSYYWHDADVIYHTSGTADINKDINMMSGTPTTGPGFIGGDVMTGANKSTSGTTSPVIGLLIYAIDATTGAVIQQAVTDATGSYSFSGLNYGSYLIHPELMNFTTVPYTGITLSAAGATKTGASFIEHTVSLTITPGNVGVSNVQALTTSIVAFPNPTSGKLNIAWNEAANETGSVSISDITGREVYKSTIQMNAGSGISQVDLSTLTNGLYIISVKSGNINYNNKIQVQH